MNPKEPHKIIHFTRGDIRNILRIIEEVEREYKIEAPRHTAIRQIQFLATARGASIAKKRIKEFLKAKYNIVKI